MSKRRTYSRFKSRYIHFFTDQDKNGMEAMFRWQNMNFFQKVWASICITFKKKELCMRKDELA